MSRGTLLVVSALVAAGLLATALNLDLPITRNALTYAKAALGLNLHDFNPWPVARELGWTSGKPVGFPMMAAPLVHLFGVNVGLMVASAVGGIAFVVGAALTIARLASRSGADPAIVPVAVTIACLNPLVIYQFWSAYPDALFAALVLAAFLLTDTIAREPERDTRLHIVGLGLAIFLALHLKLYGGILGLACPLYLLAHRSHLTQTSPRRAAKLGLLVAVFALLAATLLAARTGLYPLLVLAGEEAQGGGGGLAGYLEGLADPGWRIRGSLRSLAFAIGLNVHIALVFLLARGSWRAVAPSAVVFVALYLGGLLVFEGTWYNMRYFLPAFPFLAFALARGAAGWPARPRRAAMAGFVGLALVLVAAFNSRNAHDVVEPALDWVFPRGSARLAMLENLRLEAHLDFANYIDGINIRVPAGSTLYWVADYYGSGTHRVAEHLGISSDLTVRYALNPLSVPPQSAPVYAAVMVGLAPVDRVTRPPEWARVEALGGGVFRLVPARPPP